MGAAVAPRQIVPNEIVRAFHPAGVLLALAMLPKRYDRFIRSPPIAGVAVAGYALDFIPELPRCTGVTRTKVPGKDAAICTLNCQPQPDKLAFFLR